MGTIMSLEQAIMNLDKATIRRMMAEAQLRLLGVAAMATRQYTPDECPLKENHYDDSKLLFGKGRYKWICEFCGKKERQ